MPTPTAGRSFIASSVPQNLYHEPREFLSNFGGGTQQVGDDGHRVGAGIQDRARVGTSDASNRRQGLPGCSASGANPVQADEGVGAPFRKGSKDRAIGDVVCRTGIALLQLLEAVSGDAKNAVGPDHGARAFRRQVVLANV